MSVPALFPRMSLLLMLSALWLGSCVHSRPRQQVVAGTVQQPGRHVPEQRLVISVAQQMMVTFARDVPKRMYAVSTSKFGLGDAPGSRRTPLGRLAVVEIVGQGLPAGAKLKARQPTGEIVPVNAPGRDPIVTRILRLGGMEPRNARTMQRAIYIHGTPEEAQLKTPSSWGCVRMGSADIIRLCAWVKVGARVDIVPGRLPAPNALPP